MHNLIFRSRGRTRAALRFTSRGSHYRYEKSGVVHGLTRMRGFTQDDLAHTYCTPEQASEEIRTSNSSADPVGLRPKDFLLELSTRDEDGKKEGQVHRFRIEGSRPPRRHPEDACAANSPDLVRGAALLLKVSVQVKDAIGRTWQIDAIQYDFNQPDRFDLGVHGGRRPVSAPSRSTREARIRRALHRRPHC